MVRSLRPSWQVVRLSIRPEITLLSRVTRVSPTTVVGAPAAPRTEALAPAPRPAPASLVERVVVRNEALATALDSPLQSRTVAVAVPPLERDVLRPERGEPRRPPFRPVERLVVAAKAAAPPPEARPSSAEPPREASLPWPAATVLRSPPRREPILDGATPLEVDRLAERVISVLDRRLLAYRERTGRP
ncbi:MAG TPA: hypothetical protein VFO05_07155 [Candidatus Limnocylindrales bacterium]|nr:hypothetical protein [Candidatus Limnocylindrales bacterium]